MTPGLVKQILVCMARHVTMVTLHVKLVAIGLGSYSALPKIDVFKLQNWYSQAYTEFKFDLWSFILTDQVSIKVPRPLVSFSSFFELITMK